MAPKYFMITSFLLICSTVLTQNQNVVETKMNSLLYIGVPNLVTISKKPGECKVSMNNGTITPVKTKSNDSSAYSIYVDKSDSKPVLTITQGKEVFTYQFRKRQIPDPEFVLHASGTYTPVIGNSFYPGYFRKIQGVMLHLDNFDFDVSCKIKSFGITIIDRNGTRKEFECTGHDISKFTYLAEEGDVYIFHNIVITIVTSGEDRVLKDQVYQVKKAS